MVECPFPFDDRKETVHDRLLQKFPVSHQTCCMLFISEFRNRGALLSARPLCWFHGNKQVVIHDTILSSKGVLVGSGSWYKHTVSLPDDLGNPQLKQEAYFLKVSRMPIPKPTDFPSHGKRGAKVGFADAANLMVVRTGACLLAACSCRERGTLFTFTKDTKLFFYATVDWGVGLLCQ